MALDANSLNNITHVFPNLFDSCVPKNGPVTQNVCYCVMCRWFCEIKPCKL